MNELEVSFDAAASRLSVIDQNLEEIPPSLGATYGSSVKELAFNYNSLKYITNLDQFTLLETLTLDNNQLVAKQPFPRVESLETLSANANNIESIEVFVDVLVKCFPNLRHLSLLRNPCCPNYFVGKDSNAYQKYRYYVAGHLPNLKYLDASPVSAKEKTEGAKLVKAVAKIDPSTIERKEVSDLLDDGESEAKPLPAEDPNASPAKRTSYGVTRYIYVGRQSEGNRFIVDQQL